ncbi:hypothetical protein EDB19DRAFT_1827573 [Suillus lakei]|nr:hypothetical protein EDB19DRAFT_1827573 [Suillus lakei]
MSSGGSQIPTLMKQFHRTTSTSLGCSVEKEIDNQLIKPSLIAHSDGNKHQDISKQILYTAQNVLMHTDDEAGYALLWCIASYLHIDITIEAGKAKVLKFQTHSETNHKDIANQILELNHKSFVAEFIRSCIVFLDEEQHKLTLSQEKLEEGDDDDKPFEAHLHIGSPLRNLISLAQVEEDNRPNHAFDQFRKKLATFLNHFLPSHHIPLPDGIKWLKISLQDQDKDSNYKNIFIKLLFMFKHTVRTLFSLSFPPPAWDEDILICRPPYSRHTPSSYDSQVKLPHFITYDTLSPHFRCSHHSQVNLPHFIAYDTPSLHFRCSHHSQVKLPHFIAYYAPSLHSITFAALTTQGSLGHHLSTSALICASSTPTCLEYPPFPRYPPILI